MNDLVRELRIKNTSKLMISAMNAGLREQAEFHRRRMESLIKGRSRTQIKRMEKELLGIQS
jgi:hypothetical protein